MINPDLRLLIENSINGALYDIASVVHNILRNRYVSARLKNKLWFKFDGLKWKQIEEGPYYELSIAILRIYEEFLNELLEKDNCLKYELAEGVINSEENSIELVLKNVQNDISKVNIIIDKLKNVNFKEALCKECLYMFYDPDFMARLDKDEHVICFKDTIYNMRNKTHRNGEPSDMISIYIDMEFIDPKTEEDHSKLNDLIDNFTSFRKLLLKKRKPRHVYTLPNF
jgi:hypothetical protein